MSLNPVKLVMKVDPHRKEAGEEKGGLGACGAKLRWPIRSHYEGGNEVEI